MTRFKNLIFSLLFVSGVALGAFPGDFPADAGAVEFPGASFTGAINFDGSNPDITTTGAEDLNLVPGSDDIRIGDSTASVTITMASGSTNSGLIRQANNDASLVVSAGTNAGNGAHIELFGGAHATRTDDIEIANSSSGVIFSYDDSANTLAMGENSGTEFNLTGTNLSFNAGVASQVNVYTGRADSSLTVAGGSAGATGATLRLYAETHATLAHDFELEANGADVIRYDHSDTRLRLSGATSQFDNGNVEIDRTNIGGNVSLLVFNRDNTNTASDSVITVLAGGTSGGDAQLNLQINSGTNYYIGVDNSNADVLNIGTGTDAGAATIVQIDSSGTNVLFNSAYTVEIDGPLNHDGSTAGFMGATPVAQASHIADSAGDDATAVNAILVVLENLGFVATS